MIISCVTGCSEGSAADFDRAFLSENRKSVSSYLPSEIEASPVGYFEHLNWLVHNREDEGEDYLSSTGTPHIDILHHHRVVLEDFIHIVNEAH